MTLNQKLKNIELKDDSTAKGGTSHANETLQEFLEVAEMADVDDLNIINEALADNGIQKINKENYPQLL